MMTAQGREKGRGSEGGTAPQQNASLEPWYRVAQEAAQILVSALALYASMRSFLDKIKKRRDLKRREEA
jgi:hypothetical protein